MIENRAKHAYSSQVLITLHPLGNAGDNALKKKIEQLHVELMPIIQAEINDKKENIKFKPLNQCDNQSRIYLHGHGSSEDQANIFDTDFKAMDYKKIAEWLAANLTHPSLKDRNTRPRLKISLVMCESSGFAQKLHAELSKYGIYCDVVARIPAMYVAPSTGKKGTLALDLPRKFVNDLVSKLASKDENIHAQALKEAQIYGYHHQFRSKVIFSWDDNNQQMMRDAYEGEWKQSVLDLIQQQIVRTESQYEIKPSSLTVVQELLEHCEGDQLILAYITEIYKTRPFSSSDPEFDLFYLRLQVKIDEGLRFLDNMKYENNIRLIKDGTHQLYRWFEQAQYSDEQQIEKDIIHTILSLRDAKAYSNERIAGFNRLLLDLQSEDNLNNKLMVLENACDYRMDPYKLNQFEGNVKFSLSTVPHLTTTVQQLEKLCMNCKGRYNNLQQKNIHKI